MSRFNQLGGRVMEKPSKNSLQAIEQFNDFLAELERRRVQTILANNRPRRKFNKPRGGSNNERTRQNPATPKTDSGGAAD